MESTLILLDFRMHFYDHFLFWNYAPDKNRYIFRVNIFFYFSGWIFSFVLLYPGTPKAIDGAIYALPPARSFVIKYPDGMRINSEIVILSHFKKYLMEQMKQLARFVKLRIMQHKKRGDQAFIQAYHLEYLRIPCL